MGGGGGGIISSIFGGGQSTPKTPVIKQPEIQAAPVRESEQEAEARGVRDEEQRKLKARRGMAGTILTSPLGTVNNENTSDKLG